MGTGWRRSPFLPPPCPQEPLPHLQARIWQPGLTPPLLADLPFPRSGLCEYGDICTKAHSDQELQEWIQRARNVELREQAAWQEGLVPYQARLLAEYQHSSSEVLVVSGAS